MTLVHKNAVTGYTTEVSFSKDAASGFLQRKMRCFGTGECKACDGTSLIEVEEATRMLDYFAANAGEVKGDVAGTRKTVLGYNCGSPQAKRDAEKAAYVAAQAVEDY